VKPGFENGTQKPLDKVTFEATVSFFDSLLKLLHPIMPFITEELWQNLEERKDGETIMLQMQPAAEPYDEKIISDFETACEAIVNIRAIRQSKGISPKESLALQVAGDYPDAMTPIIRKIANVSDVTKVDSFESGAGQAFMVGTTQFNVPLSGMIDVAAEIEKIEAEIKRYEGFLRGVNAKLSNEKFVANAPAQVVELERKKLADATTKIENLQQRLSSLK